LAHACFLIAGCAAQQREPKAVQIPPHHPDAGIADAAAAVKQKGLATTKPAIPNPTTPQRPSGPKSTCISRDAFKQAQLQLDKANEARFKQAVSKAGLHWIARKGAFVVGDKPPAGYIYHTKTGRRLVIGSRVAQSRIGGETTVKLGKDKGGTLFDVSGYGRLVKTEHKWVCGQQLCPPRKPMPRPPAPAMVLLLPVHIRLEPGENWGGDARIDYEMHRLVGWPTVADCRPRSVGPAPDPRSPN
jgi:hypothetical protein